MLAAVTWKAAPSALGSGALLVFLVLAGLTFLVAQLVLGSSHGGGSARRRKLVSPDSIATMQRPGRPAPAQNRERRASLRRSGNPVKVLVSRAGPDGEEHFKALTVNRSRGGLCLSVGRPVEVGQVIQVRAAHAPPDLPGVGLRVWGCKTNGERWRLGCQFVAEPPWSALLLFG